MKGFDRRERGLVIDNLPAPNRGILTGYYETDFYGCWWEVIRPDGTEFWMIGEYPDYLIGGE